MRISYGQSSILRCTVQLAYDRFFTEFNQTNEIQQAIANPDILNRSIERRTLVDDITLGGTVPYQSTGFA